MAIAGLALNFGIVIVVTNDMVGVERVAGHVANIVRVGLVFLSSTMGTVGPTWRSWRSRRQTSKGQAKKSETHGEVN